MIFRCQICGAEQLHNTIRCERCGKPLVFPVGRDRRPVIDTYILNGHQPAPEPDILRWARWFETADRQVADTMQDDVRVSTVFLGLDHGFGGRKELFETMVFVNGSSEGGERYATWQEAEAGHARWVVKVFKATPILSLPTTGEP